MPPFLAFFSKRDQQKVLRKDPPSSQQSSPNTPTSLPPASTKSIPSPSIADTSEQLESSELSLETEYVLADAEVSPVRSHNVYPHSNGASTSTTRLKIPFRRKQSALASNSLTTTASRTTVPPTSPPKDSRKSLAESSVSVSPSLLPPPSRSAIFGSYADPHNAMSTRSLPPPVPTIHSVYTRRSSHDVPQNYETMSNPDSHTGSFPAPQAKQPNKGGLFSWARPRGRTKSKASQPDPSLTSAPVLPLLSTDSFSLRAFRHVTSPVPDTTPSSSSPDQEALPRPRPRPRGDSIASDASQRISVAAFREAQARRSTANSPVPSLPGDRESFPSGQVGNPRRSVFVAPPSVTKAGPPAPARTPLPSRPSIRRPPARSSTAPLSFAASMTTSEESSEEGESESEQEATLRPIRKRTITSRSGQSEVGLRPSLVPTYSVARSDISHGSSSRTSTRPSPSPRNKTHNPSNAEGSGFASRSSSVYSRKGASLSTSALLPDAASKRASAISKYSAASKSTYALPRSRSRASTSSDDDSEEDSEEDAPLASLVQPQRPGSATSRGSGPRRPTKPLVDIGQLVGENSAIPPCASEPSNSSYLTAETDSPARYRKTSLGLGERLSALAGGLGGLQPSRPKSPDSASDSRDEAFTPPEIPAEKPPSSPPQSPILSSPSTSYTMPASPPLKLKTNKSSPVVQSKQSKSFVTPKIDTESLKADSGISTPPSSSTSSDAPIPHITPTPIRRRQDPPAFAVTSRPISHASSPSAATFAALDDAIADTDYHPALHRSVLALAEQPKEDKQHQRRPSQEDAQTTVRVVRSTAPLKSSREEPLPVPRPQAARSRAPTGVTVSNIHLTPPSASNLPSALRQISGSGVVAPRKPFALRDSSPASSAGDSSSSRMPITPRDGSELGSGPTGRPAVGHRKRPSVTFIDEIGEKEKERKPSMGRRPPSAVVSSSSEDEDTMRGREREAEDKRRARRRTEAKAAIELGNVINGTGPIDDDDDDDDEPPMNVPPRMSMAMGNNIPFPSGPAGLQGQWGASGPAAFGNQLGNMSMQNLLNAGGQGLVGGMNSAGGMNMGVGMADPRVFAVHQQAMMIAKQTYQLAVAQQAMQDAADEWERGSALSGWTGGRSSASTPNMLSMGMGMNMNMNMGGGSGGGMGGFPGGAAPYAMSGAGGMWPGGGMSGFPGNSARGMYSGYAASEIGGGGGGGSRPSGGGGGGGGWTTSSVYGESFGGPRDRPSRAQRQSNLHLSSSPLGPGSGSGSNSTTAKREGGRPRTKTAPSYGGSAAAGQRASVAVAAASAATSTPSGHAKKRGDGPPSGYGLVGSVSPPSSWKGPPSH